MSSVMEIINPVSESSLPAMLDRAASALASARTSGEVLEARDLAGVAYDAAKSAGRFARAQKAHDDVIGAVYRAQADAALIEARAKIRLADEYDAAQERGDVASVGKPVNVSDGNNKPTSEDIGLSRKEIHDARVLRDAEKAEPGVIEAAVTERVEAGKEPTKAAIKKAAYKAVGKKSRTIDAAPLPEEQMGESDDLAQAYDTITELATENEKLRDRLAVASMDVSDAEKTHAAGTITSLRRQVETLEQELDAVKISRDTYMTKVGEMQRQINYWRRQAEKGVAA